MKRIRVPLIGLLSSLLWAAGCASAASTNTNPSGLRVTIDLKDGSRVVGQSLIETLKLQTPLLGEIKLDLKDIRSIDCSTETNWSKLVAFNGDTMTVQFAISDLRLQTAFGQVQLPVSSIHRLSISNGRRPIQTRSGLVAFWSGDGNAEDSQNQHDGVLCGAGGIAPGRINQAFSFDGDSGFVRIPKSSALDLTDQITITFWMKASLENSMSSYQGLVTSDFYGMEISNGRGGRLGVNFYLRTTGNPRPKWNAEIIATADEFTQVSDENGGGCPVTAGQWHHIAGTYDGARLQIYVDGKPWGRPVAQHGTILPMRPNSFVAIGSEDGRTTCLECIQNRYFNGLIDEVAIYNRALTAAEILAVSEMGDPSQSN